MSFNLIADGVQGLVGGIGGILKQFFGDKSEDDRAKAAIALTEVSNAHAETMAQIALSQSEVSSPDRINHWRGGLGWACVAGITYHYVLLQIFNYFAACLVSWHWVTTFPQPPDLSHDDLITLMEILGVLLGAHITPHVTGAVSAYFTNKSTNGESGK